MPSACILGLMEHCGASWTCSETLAKAQQEGVGNFLKLLPRREARGRPCLALKAAPVLPRSKKGRGRAGGGTS